MPGEQRTAARPFLVADWRDVVLVNYRVPADLLRPHVPPGSELDTPDDAPGLHVLSLVAFEFSKTRVRGWPVPTAQRFAELNFRFYARRGSMRAAVFLREFVPSPAIVVGARLLYNQPYGLARIRHRVERTRDEVLVATDFGRGRFRGKIRVRARNSPFVPSAASHEHFLKEHYWGFDRARSGASFRYRVDHPVWRLFPVEEATVAFDPGPLLGGPWERIDWERARHSVLLAEGSAATVYEAEPLVDAVPDGAGGPVGG